MKTTGSFCARRRHKLSADRRETSSLFGRVRLPWSTARRALRATAKKSDRLVRQWTRKCPSINLAWHRAWTEVTSFYAFSAAIRKIIYTTNAVESLNRMLRKTLKTKGSFTTEKTTTKLIFLAMRNFEKGGPAVREQVAARNHLAKIFAGRFDA